MQGRGQASGSGQGRGRGRGLSAPVMTFRPHKGEIPNLGMPLGADGVRITSFQGIQFPEFHFPGHDAWVGVAHIPEQQARLFDEKIVAAATEAAVDLKDPTNYVGGVLPKRGDKPFGFDAWKASLTQDCWAKLFPAKRQDNEEASTSKGKGRK